MKTQDPGRGKVEAHEGARRTLSDYLYRTNHQWVWSAPGDSKVLRCEKCEASVSL